MINNEIDLLESTINVRKQRPTTSLDSIKERVHFQSKWITGLRSSSLLEIFSTLIQRINPQQFEQGEEHNTHSELCHNQIDLTETTLFERERERERDDHQRRTELNAFLFIEQTNGSNWFQLLYESYTQVPDERFTCIANDLDNFRGMTNAEIRARWLSRCQE